MRKMAGLNPERIHSAYMLVYIRKSILDKLLRPPSPHDINPRMCEIIQKKEVLL